MRVIIALAFFLATGIAPCAPPEREAASARVLFVGNSLTYVGNTPAIFSALAAATHAPADADLLVQGGAALADRLADGSVARALAGGGYTALVLQERGGDLMCPSGPDVCAQSRHAIVHLAQIGARHGLRVVLLGTYQRHPRASLQLVESEAGAATEAGIAYVEISETLRRLRDRAPSLEWFAADGQHPGKDLALLNAVLVHEALQGTLPAPRPLTVRAPAYGAASGLEPRPTRADAPPPLPHTPLGIRYDAAALENLLGLLQQARGN